MNPLFSIITVTFNSVKNLKHTIESVKCQTFSDYEYIIIDGASSDNTLSFIDTVKTSCFKILSETDEGIYDAMNKGLDLAKGEYVLFLNAGDTFHSNSILLKVADIVKEYNYPGIIYGQTRIVDENRKYLGERHLDAPEVLSVESFSKGMLVCHQAFFALRKITSPYNRKYRFSADYEWCIKCLQHSKKNVYIGDEPIIDYLAEGATTQNHFKSLMERFRIMTTYYGVTKTLGNHIQFIARAFKRKIK